MSNKNRYFTLDADNGYSGYSFDALVVEAKKIMEKPKFGYNAVELIFNRVSCIVRKNSNPKTLFKKYKKDKDTNIVLSESGANIVSYDPPLGSVEIVLKRKNPEVLNLFVVNEKEEQVFLFSFNQASEYGKKLMKQYKIDLTQIK